MAYAREWEEAAEYSRDGKAVAKVDYLVQDRSGKWVKADIVKTKGRNGYFVYRKTMTRIKDATTQEVDRATGWRAW
jgi:hypothetical protein